MIVGETGLLIEPHDTESGSDGTPSGAEYGAGDQHQHVSPRRNVKQSLNGCSQTLSRLDTT